MNIQKFLLEFSVTELSASEKENTIGEEQEVEGRVFAAFCTYSFDLKYFREFSEFIKAIQTASASE